VEANHARFNAIEEGLVLTILESMKRNAKPLRRDAKIEKPSARMILPMTTHVVCDVACGGRSDRALRG